MGRKISPEQDYLQAQQSLREAQIAVANAQQKLSAIGATPASSALGRYELRAPFDGMVVEKHLSLGESVKEDANVFTLSDLSTVWAEISVAAQHLPLVRGGERVTVRSTAFDAKAEGEVSYVGALIGAQTRMATARVAVLNPQKVWRPGLFVEVELVSSETAAPVTVLTDAVQTIDEKPWSSFGSKAASSLSQCNWAAPMASGSRSSRGWRPVQPMPRPAASS